MPRTYIDPGCMLRDTYVYMINFFFFIVFKVWWVNFKIQQTTNWHFSYFSQKIGFDIHASYCRQFTWNVKTYFLGKLNKYFKLPSAEFFAQYAKCQNRRQWWYFFLFIRENRFKHFMQIVPVVDNLHKMSKLSFCEKIKKKTYRLLEFLPGC